MTGAEPMVTAPAQWGAFGVLLVVVATIGFLVMKGYLVPRRTVDTLLAGKDARIAAAEAEADEWRHAWRDDHDLVVVMSGQVGDLLVAAQGSAKALESLTFEARQRR